MLLQGSREGRTGERNKVTHGASAAEASFDVTKNSGAGWTFRIKLREGGHTTLITTVISHWPRGAS